MCQPWPHNLNQTVSGKAGTVHINGGDGIDVLSGGKGRDILIGGADTDYFSFKSHAGIEIINDFVDGTDRLLFGLGKEIKDVADLLAHHVHQDGNNVVISGDGTEMIIRHFDVDNLTIADFGI